MAGGRELRASELAMLLVAYSAADPAEPLESDVGIRDTLRRAGLVATSSHELTPRGRVLVSALLACGRLAVAGMEGVR